MGFFWSVFSRIRTRNHVFGHFSHSVKGDRRKILKWHGLALTQDFTDKVLSFIFFFLFSLLLLDFFLPCFFFVPPLLLLSFPIAIVKFLVLIFTSSVSPSLLSPKNLKLNVLASPWDRCQVCIKLETKHVIHQKLAHFL